MSDEPKINCPRCKSEKVESASRVGVRMTPAWKECRWCGLRFAVNEQGKQISGTTEESDFFRFASKFWGDKW